MSADLSDADLEDLATAAVENGWRNGADLERVVVQIVTRHLSAAEMAVTLERHETSLVRSARGESMAEVEHYKAECDSLRQKVARVEALISPEAAMAMRLNGRRWFEEADIAAALADPEATS